jgi:hypothetical protein
VKEASEQIEGSETDYRLTVTLAPDLGDGFSAITGAPLNRIKFDGPAAARLEVNVTDFARRLRARLGAFEGRDALDLGLTPFLPAEIAMPRRSHVEPPTLLARLVARNAAYPSASPTIFDEKVAGARVG